MIGSRSIIVPAQDRWQRTKPADLVRSTRASPAAPIRVGAWWRAGSCALALGFHLLRAPVEIGADELDQVVDPVLEEVVGLRHDRVLDFDTPLDLGLDGQLRHRGRW